MRRGCWPRPTPTAGLNEHERAHNIIGGALGRNVVSGNLRHGVTIGGGGSNIIAGNYIGVASSGRAALGNGGLGVSLRGGTQRQRDRRRNGGRPQCHQR